MPNEENLIEKMRDGKPGWEARAAKATPDSFKIEIIIKDELLKDLSDSEIEELDRLLRIVQTCATYQAIGMFKGLVKYHGNSQEATLEYWIAHLVTEQADQMNYAGLTYNAYKNMKAKGLIK